MHPFPLLAEFELIAPEDLSPAQNIAVDRLPGQGGIGIASDRELDAVVTTAGHVVAGLWTSWRADRFTFDVVVVPQAKGRGIAKYLPARALNDFNDTREAYADAHMVIHVVNPAMRHLLESHFGFSVALTRGRDHWEMIPTTNNAGAVFIPKPEEIQDALAA